MNTPIPSEDLTAKNATSDASVQTGPAAPQNGVTQVPRGARRQPIAIHCDCED